MRKFKIKNRQKRKYTRKNAPQPSMPLEGGWSFGLLPFLVLAIALFTTLIISHNLREQDLVIEFAFQLPTFSTEPFEQFIASIPSLLTQPTAFVASLWTLVIESVIGFGVFVSDASTAAATVIVSAIAQIATMLDPRPVITAMGNGITSGGTAIGTFFVQLFEAIVFAINYIIQSLLAFFVLIGQAISFAASLVYSAVVFVMNAILDALIVVANTLTAITITVYQAIAAAVQFTIVKVNAFVDATLYFLGTPFRMLAAFWEVIKPYVEIFMQHLQMAGADLNNGFKALSNFSSIIGPTK